MSIKSAKEFFVNRLIFPRVITLEEPGRIISRTTRKLSSVTSNRRMVYDFEDIFASLQLRTINKMGDKGASDLFYRIGKQVGAQYKFFFGNTKIPDFFLEDAVRYIFLNLSSVGMSFAKKVSFNHVEKKLVLEGDGTIVCRKTGNPYLFAGIVSGLLSLLANENIEAEPQCEECSKKCRIVADKKIPEKYIPEEKEIEIAKDYNQINFGKIQQTQQRFQSFKELYGSEKIRVDEGGKICFNNKTLFFSEANMSGVITSNYLKEDRNLLCEAVVTSSEKMASELMTKCKNEKEKLNFLQNMLSAFGQGLLFVRFERDGLFLRVLNPPIGKDGFFYHALELNGYLNHILGKKMRMKEIKTSYNPVVTSISYEF